MMKMMTFAFTVVFMLACFISKQPTLYESKCRKLKITCSRYERAKRIDSTNGMMKNNLNQLHRIRLHRAADTERISALACMILHLFDDKNRI